MAGLYDIMDEAIAHELGVTAEEYIDRIEKLPFRRAQAVIGACFTEDPKLLEKARRIFYNCRTANKNDGNK